MKSHAQLRVTSWDRPNAASFLTRPRKAFRMRTPRPSNLFRRWRKSRSSWSMTLHTTYSCWRSSFSRSQCRSSFWRSNLLRPIQERMPWRSLNPSSSAISISSTSYSWTLICPWWMEFSAWKRLKNWSGGLRLATKPSSSQSPDWHRANTRRSTRVALSTNSMVIVCPFSSLTNCYIVEKPIQFDLLR